MKEDYFRTITNQNPWNPRNFLFKLFRNRILRPVFEEFFGRADEAAGFCIERAPEGEAFYEEFAVGFPVNLGVAFEEVFTGFADPCFYNDGVSENG